MEIKQKKPFILGYWLIKSKPLLKKIAKYISIGLVVLIWINFVLQTINYLTNINRHKEVLKSLTTNYVNFDANGNPQSLIITDSAAFNRESGKFDLFARLTNPNHYWGAAVVTYQFVVGGANIPPQTTSLLPGQEKFISQSNVAINSSVVTDTVLKIINIQWQGIKIKVPEAKFDFKDAQYLPVEFSETSDSAGNFSRLTVTAANRSIYGFKNVKITVLLKSSGQNVGLGTQNYSNFLAGEEKNLEFSWPRKFPINVQPEFRVDTDVLDTNNLILLSDLP